MPGDSSLFDIPPPKFGRYRVQHQIGVGTTGPVFRAEDPETHTPVVVKVLRTFLPPDINQMVVDDLIGIIARSPAHPSLVPSRAAGIEEDEPYYVSDVAPGEALDVALQQYGPGAIADVLPRVRAIAEALDVAADHGFCHGALHPRDIFVSEQSTHVTGIGVAEILGRRGSAVSIRRPYSPPEIARGEAPARAADQFSLAAITFEWLFGEPITGPAYTPLEVPALPDVKRDALSDAFTRALAPVPSARFPSCRAFVRALEASVSPTVAVPAVDLDQAAEAPLRSAQDTEWDEEETLDAPLSLDGAGSDTETVIRPGFSSTSMFATPDTGRRGFGLGALAATLFFGLAVGLGGGYFASTRLWPMTTSAAPQAPAPASRRPVPPEEMRSATKTPAPTPGPATGSGTDVPVAPAAEPKVPDPTPPAIAEAKKETRRAPNIAPVQSERVLPGSLVVDSRPPGAAVTINGVPRGKTPLSVDRVAPGDYIITMRLTDFRPVTITVHISAGEKARAAASLTKEQE